MKNNVSSVTSAADYEAVLADHRRLVRELDVLLNGDGAAQQASLCDVVGQVARYQRLFGMPLAKVLDALLAAEREADNSKEWANG